jgi:hypothetical protein
VKVPDENHSITQAFSYLNQAEWKETRKMRETHAPLKWESEVENQLGYRAST